MRYILIGLLCASAWGQSPVVVTGPLKMADASGFNGDLTVSWPAMVCGTTPVRKGSQTYKVVGGVVPTIQVYPTASCGNNRYTVNYTGGTVAYWTIPTTPSSQSILSIETLTTPALPVIPPFAIGQVSGLQAALDSLALLIPGSAVPSVFGRTGPITASSGDYSAHYEAKDATILKSGGSYSDPSWLTLSIAKVTGLQTALDAKADTSSIETVTAGTGLAKLLSEISVDNTTTPTVLSGAGAPSGACTGVDLYRDTTAHQLYYCESGTWRPVGTTYTPPVTTKGDIFVYGAAATRLPVGATTGHVLTVNPATATGLEWAAQTGGGGSTTGLYSGTLDFGVIPDLGCSSLTMTATGLTTGKALALSLPAALETGLIGTAFASAADTATVRLCNVSGVSVNPASATFKVRDMDSLGYLTASATINFGAIGDGNCLASTLTVTGSATGDNVAAGWPPGLEAGLTGSMFVSAADTVAVRLCNFSGAAVDPASATFKAAITR